ncbi:MULTISPECIES: hypothetical protein [unclassified Novosphingobium]|uniref:hypothetical protein n=1 Tax=unclassified Novosphingobium TaxID=2644732 RepID=UPI00031BB2E3|nr:MULTISPECIES: hypothetical protein [unclassified Novosphingobium]GFM28562.1 uncharacterized protein PY1_contig-04-610 [Novosphingobium sp. PY1]
MAQQASFTTLALLRCSVKSGLLHRDTSNAQLDDALHGQLNAIQRIIVRNQNG